MDKTKTLGQVLTYNDYRLLAGNVSVDSTTSVAAGLEKAKKVLAKQRDEARESGETAKDLEYIERITRAEKAIQALELGNIFSTDAFIELFDNINGIYKDITISRALGILKSAKEKAEKRINERKVKLEYVEESYGPLVTKLSALTETNNKEENNEKNS